MKKKGTQNNRHKDYYSRKAKEESYPARSVYKLQEIQQKYKIMKTGDKILDLGCFPGSWLLYAADVAGISGSVVGIDIKSVSIKLPSNVSVHMGDLSDGYKGFEDIEKDYNVVLSDMAPSTSGNKFVDVTVSFNLAMAALSFAQNTLLKGGRFACKIFQGEDFNKFSDSVKSNFKKTHIFKPKSSRKPSREIYIIGLGKRNI